MQPRRFGELSESRLEESYRGIERLMEEQQLRHVHPVFLDQRTQLDCAPQSLLRAMGITQLVIRVAGDRVPLGGVLRGGIEADQNGSGIGVTSLRRGQARERKQLLCK